MQEYAHRGVATRCFSGDAVGVMEFLPWARRISPITKTNIERSEEFFTSLQSDILGESIVIHGPADQTMMIPRSATALDGAFYLFGEEAFLLTAIKVDGKEVSFHMPLRNAVSLEIVIGKRRTVEREWLQWVQTGLATSKIRGALMQQPQKKKIAVGEQILQAEFDRYGKGGVRSSLSADKTLFSAFPVQSLDDICVLIAEGLLSPSDVLQRAIERRWRERGKIFFQQVLRRYMPHLFSRDLVLRLSVRGKQENDRSIQETVAYLCRKHHVVQEKASVYQRGDGEYRAQLSVRSHDRANLDSFFLELQAQAHVLKIKVHPPLALLLQLGTTLLISLGTWLLFLFLLKYVTGHGAPAAVVYSAVVPVLVSNFLGYRFVANYFPVVRHSQWFVLLTFGVNILAVGLYTATILIYQLDILRLSLFLPLTLLVLSCIAVSYLFIQRHPLLSTGSLQVLPQRTQTLQQRQKLYGYLLRLGAVIIWGIEPLYIKYTLTNSIDPGMRVFLKSVGGIFPSILLGGVLAPIVMRQKMNWRLPYTSLFALIIVGEVFFTYFINASLVYTSGTNVILLNNFAPVLALIIAAFFWRDRIPYLRKTSSVAAMLLTFTIGSIGTTLLFYNSRSVSVTNVYGDFLGTLMMLTDVILVTAMIRYVQFLKVSRSIALNLNIFLCVFLVSAPLAFLGGQPFWTLSREQLLFGIGAGVLSGFGRILNFEAFRLIDGFIAYLMFNIAIFLTFILEAFLLQEILPTISLLLGGIMISVASIVAEYINSRSERETVIRNEVI
jgi:drug/metabolite transporter (DMT)-like permease